ncbi:serine O-acetyltransferase [Sphingobacterium hungaricum]|uniref:Serine acetyltransferase n=1 Tax=Sphingobacterium hungaricum TaxID=2082723 RepID=A0A928UY35_9SPHI|nr:serine acetyltransferase [Sphingobacterium hungaricum]MBE8714123.1 serine acetyltransferase [Sphingobacterium hungaricum]
MVKNFKDDIYRYTGGTGLTAFFKAWRNPGFRFILFFRIVSSSRKYSLRWSMAFPFYRHYFIKYGIQIPTSVKIGRGLLLPHFGGIVINSKSKIGNNCNILQNVTLGNSKGGKKAGSPTIGDNVYIGPGAVIVGGIFVGNNVLIAGNAFVNFDVPDNSIVLGNPAQIIRKDSPTIEYIGWRIHI